MRNKKLGFTLAEVLISMMIIGVIMALSMQTIKIVKASYTSLAYFEYKTIKQIAGEMIAGTFPYTVYDDNGNKLEPSTTTHKLKNGARIQVITPEDNLFCNTLVSMVNAAGKKNCTNLYSAGMDTEPYIQDIDINAPTFMTTAGKRYFLTKRTSNPSVSKEFGYRLLAIDLNSKQAPNITKRVKGKIPDIITFLILDNGEIYPLGVAGNNLNMPNGDTIVYLNAKLKGYYYSDTEHTGGVPEDCVLKAGKKKVKTVCNYSVVYVPNRTKDANNKLSFYSYREAYCASLGTKESNYLTYCNGLSGESLCPPSTSDQRFDTCRVEIVKPAFRYNF